MKKVLSIVLVLAMVLAFAGCGPNDNSLPHEIRDTKDIHFMYDFPEPTYHIVVNYEGAGKSETFEFGAEEYSEDNMLKVSPLVNWFYDLEIQPESISPENIEPAEGNEVFTFIVNGEEAFWYDNRGNKAYLCVDGQYYVVSNPSNPISESGAD